MIEKLPIYSNVPETLAKRKEQFYKEVGGIYARLKPMTKEEYFQIKQDFDAGDRTALDRLMDKSVYFIVEDVVGAFAKYDIAGVLSIEDVLSVCIEHFNSYLHKFESLPDVYSKYTNSVIQQYIFFKVVREYVLETRRTKNLDVMNDDQLAVAVDAERCYIMTDVETNKKEFNKVLDQILKEFSPRQAQIIKMYFDVDNPKDGKQIAEEYCITIGRVFQLLRDALEKIRSSKKIHRLEIFRDASFKDKFGLDL